MNRQSSFLSHPLVMAFHLSSLCLSSAVSSLSLNAASPLLSTLFHLSILQNNRKKLTTQSRSYKRL